MGTIRSDNLLITISSLLPETVQQNKPHIMEFRVTNQLTVNQLSLQKSDNIGYFNTVRCHNSNSTINNGQLKFYTLSGVHFFYCHRIELHLFYADFLLSDYTIPFNNTGHSWAWVGLSSRPPSQSRRCSEDCNGIRLSNEAEPGVIFNMLWNWVNRGAFREK